MDHWTTNARPRSISNISRDHQWTDGGEDEEVPNNDEEVNRHNDEEVHRHRAIKGPHDDEGEKAHRHGAINGPHDVEGEDED